MNKYLSLIAVLSIIICQNLFADSMSVSEFTVIITKVEVSYDSGSTYTTIYESDTGTTIDVASFNQNTIASSLPLASDLPSGTINKIRVTIGTTVSFTGWYLYTTDGQYYYHTAKTIAYSDLLTTACSTSGSVPTPGKVTVTGVPESVRTNTFDCTISVSEGQITTAKLNLNLSESLILQTNKLYSAPLSTIGSIGT